MIWLPCSRRLALAFFLSFSLEPLPFLIFLFLSFSKKKNPASALLKLIPPLNLSPLISLLYFWLGVKGWRAVWSGVCTSTWAPGFSSFSTDLDYPLSSFLFPLKCRPSQHFLLELNDFRSISLMRPYAPPQNLSPLLFVLYRTGTTIYQCQSQVLQLNSLAHIDYHWIKNKAWCKFQIKVDNGIIRANHDLLMNLLISPSAPLVRGNMRAKWRKMFFGQWPFHLHSLTLYKPEITDVIIQEENIWKWKLRERPRDSQPYYKCKWWY